MEIWDRKALAFAALQRLWVADGPASAEDRWQKDFAFLRLPEELKTPGHWYRHEGQTEFETGFIQYYLSGDRGQFFATLPAGIDPASVVVIPKVAGFPTIYDRMKEMLLKASGVKSPAELQPGAKAILDDMDELRGPNHERRIKFMIIGEGSDALHSGREAVSRYLSDKLAAVSTQDLGLSRITGFEVASLMLLDSLTRQLLAADPAPPPTLFFKMFDPTMVASLPDLVFRFVQDCFKAGMGIAAMGAFEQIRKGGDGTLAVFRAKEPGEMHVGLYLDSYYAGLQQAGIRFQAARWGCQSALTYGHLSEPDRKLLEKRLNTSEEKLVRTGSALAYAVKDLDGSRYRDWQRQIREARAAGDEKKESAILGNTFNSNILYPVALRDVMVKGALAVEPNTALA